ncbi:SIMPL domain-containing protein [uncultured Brevundimonas sp.]|uniref:SIMPL domain-containing protein n=1 Tax=uncultured Brevundimonas sp. TaxID=213418 RepID=UPI0030ED6215|tara:strand:- start:919 stop:1713 length:795 start_codon:yes stop_codon:yes gene_type:complete
MKTIFCGIAAAFAVAMPATAQDLAGPVAAAVDQFGQSVAESMAGAPGVFVTAQGRASLPAASAAPMTLTIMGTGTTATEAVAERNTSLERVRAVANRFNVQLDVAAANYRVAEDVAANDYLMAVRSRSLEPAGAGPADVDETGPTVTSTVRVSLIRPDEARLAPFIDALIAAGVTNLQDSLNAPEFGTMGPLLAMLGLNAASDPGEAVWNAATADGVARARAQANAIAAASNRRLGSVRYVSVLMRSHDADSALVSVAVRFAFD